MQSIMVSCRSQQNAQRKSTQHHHPKLQHHTLKDDDQTHDTSSSTQSTLALLDLMLGASRHQTQLAEQSVTHRTSDDPAANFIDAASATQHNNHSQLVQLQAAIWSEAWSALEASQPPQCAKPQRVANSSRFRFRPFGGASRGHQRQKSMPKPQQSTAQQQQPQSSSTASAGTPIKRAQLHLQGLDTKARLQLLALSLASLERLVGAVTSANIR